MYVTTIKKYKNPPEIIIIKILKTHLLMHLSTFRYTYIMFFLFVLVEVLFIILKIFLL